MTMRIMVYLSGEQDADLIVPLLQKSIDRNETMEVVFVRVDPPSPASVVDFPLDYGDVARADAVKRAEAESFLRGVAQRIRWGSHYYKTIALLGDEADSLSRFFEEQSFDAVLMVSHKQSRLRQLFFGNSLNRVLNTVHAPVTVLKAA